MSFRIASALLSVLLLGSLFSVSAQSAEPIDFARRIRPILAEKCFACHGPDEESREADLRLDTPDAWQSEQGESTQVVVPGKPAESALIHRVVSRDDDERMPPPDFGEPLDDEEVELLRRWIREGAKWRRHWALAPPKRPATPTIDAPSNWARNAIDRFVLARLHDAGVQPSPAADRATLIRRLSFDLTGLPPTPDEVAAFEKDASDKAYERVVDRLLDSPRFGERMAMAWLDAARYADTDGFQIDATRSNWPWRDWVIQSYNTNQSFDQFTIEQFAGDLFPNAKPEQILATCFHRNHMTNGEGGRDPEESRIDYVIDRVNTMGTVWLGLTLGCCQCHSHKYDAVTQAEYYSLNAFFNSIDEDGKAGGGAKPFLSYTSPYAGAGVQANEDWLRRMNEAKEAAETKALQDYPVWLESERTRFQKEGGASWRTQRFDEMRSGAGAELQQEENLEVAVTGANARHDDYTLTLRPSLSRIAGMRLRLLPQPGEGGVLSAHKDGHVILTNVKVHVARRGSTQFRVVDVAKVLANYERKKGGKNYGYVSGVLDDDPRTGWTTEGSKATEAKLAVFAFETPVVLKADEHLVIELRQRSLKGHSNIRRFRVELTSEAGPTSRRLGASPLESLTKKGDLESLDKSEQGALREQFFADRPLVQAARRDAERARQQRDANRRAAKPQKVMVLGRRKQPRKTHLLVRGVWDQKGEEVQPNSPAILSPWPASAPRDRMGLAKWLVAKDNPLTARVTVNRYWQMLFGAGLVRTPDDFGVQGEPPTHPKLLDWLAVEFMETGWDRKRLIKTIVMSQTYRQRSDVTPGSLERDPQNRLFARGARYRLPSWMIRDAALAFSGLLDDRLGGPPVYPHQPPGVWAASTMGRFHYEPSVGGDVYRRSLYSFWRRSVAPTAFFDAAKRRVCEVRTVRTNTPLHALTLLNDVTFVEAARVLAERAIQRNKTLQSQLHELSLRVLSRPLRESELNVLLSQHRDGVEFYRANQQAAREAVRHGQRPPAKEIDAAELAALTLVASTLMNLDEAITRE